MSVSPRGRAWFPEVGLIAMVVVGPALVFPGPLWQSAPSLMLAAALLASALGVIQLRHTSVAWSVSVLAVAVWMGWALVLHRDDAFSHLAGAALGLLAMGTVCARATSPTHRLVVVAIMAVMGAAATIVGLAGASVPSPKWLALGNLPQWRLALDGLGPSGAVNPNAVAAVAILTMPLGAGLSRVRAVAGVRALGASVVVVTAVALILVQSRSAGLALAVMALVLVSAALFRRFGRWAVCAMWLGAGAIAAGLIAEALAVQSSDPSTQTLAVRVSIWTQALQRLAESPITGIGLNEFQHTTGTTYEVAHAHNIALQTALDTGILGFMAWATLHGATLVRAGRLLRGAVVDADDRLVVLMAAGTTIAGLAFGLMDAVALGAKVGLLQWMALGLLWAVPTPAGPSTIA